MKVFFRVPALGVWMVNYVSKHDLDYMLGSSEFLDMKNGKPIYYSGIFSPSIQVQYSKTEWEF